MAMWLSTTQVKHARKVHRCATCWQAAVQPGDPYTRDVYVDDDQRAYTWIQCAACKAISDEVYAWLADPEVGADWDDYSEWARAHPDRDDARAFLRRIEGQ